MTGLTRAFASQTRGFLGRRGWLAVALVFGAAATSCGDPTPTAPAAVGAPQASLIGDILSRWLLLDSCASLPTATVTQTVGRAGGVIVVGPDTLRIPRGALSQPVTIQASLPAGYFINIVVFQPTGLKFHKPASLTMGYSNCSLLRDWDLRIAQVTDDLKIIEYLSSTNDKGKKTVTGQVHHFSNYAVAW